MELIVCLKQVPDTEAQIKVGADGKSIDEAEIKWVMNPYDEFGVEEALKIKEAKGGTVTVVSVGPARVTEALRTALAMGADQALHVDDEATLGGDSYSTALVLAAALKDRPYDIIFCGQRAVDDDRGQVGSILAEMLDIPAVTVINKLEVEDGSVTANRPVEGQVMVIKSPLPVVLTAQKGLNEPRYASLPGIMKAKKKPLEVKKLADLGLDPGQAGSAGALVEVVKMVPPPEREAGIVVEGETPQEKAAKLADLLHNQAKVV
ncbi:MAG: electron transfer flavoprotein subunit beta/FixA family protein [Deltaproteobacteria bacterium]|nr:electron transfer flavoprotein subunit beta/FixA family protein [Deltaproteobacteria bacterium]